MRWGVARSSNAGMRCRQPSDLKLFHRHTPPLAATRAGLHCCLLGCTSCSISAVPSSVEDKSVAAAAQQQPEASMTRCSRCVSVQNQLIECVLYVIRCLLHSRSNQKFRTQALLAAHYNCNRVMLLLGLGASIFSKFHRQQAC